MAAQSLEGLGFLYPDEPTSEAKGLSSDGSVAVGASYNGEDTEAFRWVGGTMTGLGTLGGTWSAANAVNSDGTVVVGISGNGDGKDEAFRWTELGMVGLGFLDETDILSSVAFGVNADGTVVVGQSYNGTTDVAFRWTEADGMQDLGISGFSWATDVSDDGTVVVGTMGNEAFRWVEGDGVTGLGFLSGDEESWANSVTADGNLVVGASWNGSDIQAFYWTDDDGMVGLDFLPGGSSSEAFTVNPDGTVIVGNSDGEAVRWVGSTVEGFEIASIRQLLEDAGVDLDDWATLNNATGVSADGNIIVGTGFDSGFIQEAWIANLAPGGGEPGLITPDAALASLQTLGQAPATGSSLLSGFLDTNSEFARQHAANNGEVVVLPLGYAQEGDGYDAGYALAPARRLRVFGYGFGGGSFDPDGWSGAGLIGASAAVTDNLIAGASLGYGAVGSDTDFGGDTTVRGVAGTAFLASTPETGLQLLAAGIVARLDADIRRGYENGSGLASSSGETDGVGYGGLVRAGYAFSLDETNRVEPFVAYHATHVELDGYTETGGPFPADVGELSQTDHVGRLGAEIRHLFQPDAWLWGSAAWGHRLDDSGTSVAAQLVGLFGISGTAPAGASDWLEVAVGASLPVGSSTRLTGSVTAGLFGEGGDTVLGRLGVSAAF